jgi:diguanylate cyclase (GGDEF)-like protein
VVGAGGGDGVVGEGPGRRYVVPIQGGRPAVPAHPRDPAGPLDGPDDLLDGLLEEPMRDGDGRERFRALFEQATAGVALSELDGRFTEVNPALRSLLTGTGVDPDAGTLTDLLTLGDPSGDWQPAMAGVCSGRAPVVRAELALTAGTRSDPRRVSATTAMVVLGERRYLLTHVADAIVLDGVIGIALDGFDRVDATLGRDGGDQVLAAVAARLKATLRTTDHVRRSGRTGFVVIAQVDGARSLAALARRLVRALDEPVDTDRARLRVGAELGTALGRHGEPVEAVTRRAEQALAAVRKGRRPTARVDLDAVQLTLLPELAEESERRSDGAGATDR